MIEYNLPQEKGRNTEQMPILLAANRTPLSVAGLRQRQLELKEAPRSIKETWLNNYFNAGDAIAYHLDGTKVKISLDSQELRELTPQSPVSKGALVLQDYGSIQGIEHQRDNLGILGEWLTQEQALESLFWKILHHHPDEVPEELAIHGLHEEAVPYIFAQAKENFGYKTAMGIYLASAQEDHSLRALWVNGLGGGSYVNGGCDLGDGGGRLAGLASETPQPQHAAASRAPETHQILTVEEIIEQAGELEDFDRTRLAKIDAILKEEGYKITRSQ